MKDITPQSPQTLFQVGPGKGPSLCKWLVFFIVLSLSSWVQAATCKQYGIGVKVATIEHDKVDESSGIVASRLNPGVFWTHNDSGDKPRIFAMDEKGRHLGTYTVTGANAFDWEDIAAGPCPDGTPCLYVGDIGDNNKIRPNVQVYRFPEPKVDLKNPKDGVTAKADLFNIQYPDGKFNCETLLVHPKTRDIILVTKDAGVAGVYRLDGSVAPGDVTLKKLNMLKLPKGDTLTGGDLSPEGDQVVLRAYTYGILYATGSDGIPTDANQIGVLTLPLTIQGEAIAYALDGRALFLTSERLPAPLFKLSCTEPTCKDGETRPCYTGPAGTGGRGLCAPGKETCLAAKWGACVGDVKPGPETCNGKDDDCDGQIDNQGGGTTPLKQACPAACGGGEMTCQAGGWSDCSVPCAVEVKKEAVGTDAGAKTDADNTAPKGGCQCDSVGPHNPIFWVFFVLFSMGLIFRARHSH